MPTRPRSFRRWAALSFVALVLGCIGIWALGADISLLSTRGVSMQPLFSGGDLAITAKTDQYRIGDIVAYRVPGDDAVVLHRIRSIEGDRYVFKGDNNSWLDPIRPRQEDLVGRLLARVPKAGFISDYLSSPARWFIVLGLALLLFAGSGAHRDRRRPRTEVRRRAELPFDLEDTTSRFGPPMTAIGMVMVLLAIVFSRDTSVPTERNRSVDHSMTYEYSGQPPVGATYPDGTLRTGDPVFLRLIQSIDLDLMYRVSGRDLGDVSGSYTVDAVVADPGSGSWRTTTRLIDPTKFTGASFTARARLDFAALQREVDAVRAETGVPGSTVTVSLIPKVALDGSLSGVDFSHTYNTPVDFSLTPLQLTLVTPPDPVGTPLVVSESETIKVPGTKAEQLSFLGRKMPVSTARWASLVLLFATLGWLGVALAQHRSQRVGPEPDRISSRYRASMVQVTRVPALDHAVDVADITALQRIADHGGHLVLHHVETNGEHSYLVENSGSLFRYRPRPEPAVSPQVHVEVDVEPEPALNVEIVEAPELEFEPVGLETLLERSVEEGLDADDFQELLARLGMNTVADDVAESPPPPETLDDATRLTEMTGEELAIFGFPNADATVAPVTASKDGSGGDAGDGDGRGGARPV